MKKLLALILIASISIIGLSGCVIELGDGLDIGVGDDSFSVEFDGEHVEIGDLKTYEQEFELGDQEALDVELDINAAKIDVQRSEDKLFEGEVESNIVGFAPRMVLKGNNLIIKDEFKYRSFKSFKNNWDLKITDQVPLRFDININACKSDFDFTGLMISEIKIYANATDTYIRFDEMNEEKMDRMDIDINAGNIEVYGIGNSRAEEVNVEVNAGKVALEFGENITNDIEILIEGNASQTTLDLPDDVGISIEKRSTLSSLDIKESDFIKDDDIYKSENYDTAEYKVDIEVRGTAFNLTVR